MEKQMGKPGPGYSIPVVCSLNKQEDFGFITAWYLRKNIMNGVSETARKGRFIVLQKGRTDVIQAAGWRESDSLFPRPKNDFFSIG